MKSINRTKGGIMGLLRPVGLVCFVAVAALCASAEDTTLKVELRNGTVDEFILAEKPVITFNGESCVISCKAVDATYDMGDIVSAYFKEGTNPSGVDETLGGFSINLTDPSVAVVSGVTPGASVTLYSLNGIIVLSMHADADGIARIPLDNLASRTVYVVSINKVKNFKLYKK